MVEATAREHQVGGMYRVLWLRWTTIPFNLVSRLSAKAIALIKKAVIQ
jgi:hypothetical protein